jgi:aspartate/methionine/tyrosine aminotransferase
MSRLGTETAFEVLARAQALERQGKHIVHLELGEPDFCSPDSAIKAGVDSLISGLTKYTTSPGLLDLRSQIAEIEGPRRNLRFSPDQVVITPGGKPVMFYTILAMVDDGDEVLYPDPGFPIYESMIGFAGGVPVPYPLRESNGFQIDFDHLRAHVSPRTRLVILNSPSNPTGGVESQESLSHLAELLRPTDAWILSDEIYSHFIFEGRHGSIASFDDLASRTVILDGFSKTYSMTGWRLGFGIMPAELAQRITQLVINSVSCTPVFTQRGGLAALETREETIPRMIEEFRRRRDVVVDGLNAMPGVRCQKPRGTFYAFPNVSSFGKSSKAVADYLLDQGGVACLAGTAFGREGEGYLRLSFGTSMENIREGLKLMGNALARLS